MADENKYSASIIYHDVYSASVLPAVPNGAAEEWSRGLGRWSLMREVQSSNPHGGYTPHVSTWHGVTPPDCDQWQGW